MLNKSKTEKSFSYSWWKINKIQFQSSIMCFYSGVDENVYFQMPEIVLLPNHQYFIQSDSHGYWLR